jgi:hypothetical protein
MGRAMLNERIAAVSRRDRLIGLLVLEALLLLFFMAQLAAPGSTATVFVTLSGARIFPLVLLLTIAVCALPIIIGALSHRWQGAIALNVIASLPALVLSIFGSGLQTPSVNVLILPATLAALGWFGWLLRFVRAEFSA